MLKRYAKWLNLAATARNPRATIAVQPTEMTEVNSVADNARHLEPEVLVARRPVSNETVGEVERINELQPLRERVIGEHLEDPPHSR